MYSSKPLLRSIAIFFLLSAIALAQGASRTIALPVSNMYSSASTDSDVVSQAIYGTTVNLLQEVEGWSEIQTPDQYKGWVHSSDLLNTQYATGQNVVQVRSLFAHLYREMSVTRHAPVLTVPFETKLEVAARATHTERWTEVSLAGGGSAYVQNGDIGPVVNNLSIDDTIALARKFLGLPYTWGGTSSYGYDCSGFTQMLIRQRGRLMPRDADIQATWSGLVPVERKDLKPGDLLYFGDSLQKITHTGMYIGDGRFIDATTHETPMVRIDNLNEPYWTKLLVAARRLKQ